MPQNICLTFSLSSFKAQFKTLLHQLFYNIYLVVCLPSRIDERGCLVGFFLFVVVVVLGY